MTRIIKQINSQAKQAWDISVEEAIEMGFDAMHTPRFVIGDGTGEPLPCVGGALFEDFWLIIGYGTETKVKYFDRYDFRGTPAIAQLKKYMEAEPLNAVGFAFWERMLNPNDTLGISDHIEANKEIFPTLQTMRLAIAMERVDRKGKPRTKTRELAKKFKKEMKFIMNTDRLERIERAGLPDVAFEALYNEIEMLLSDDSTIFVKHF